MDIAGNEGRDEANVQQRGGSGLCQATARDGRPCRAPVLRDGQFCYMHEPAKASERQEAARRGGASTSSRRRLLLGRLVFGTSEEIRQGRQALASAVIQGQVTPQRATVIAALLRDAEAGLPRADLERQIAELSETLAKLEREQ